MPKKNRILEFHDIAEGKAEPKGGDPSVVELRRRVQSFTRRVASGQPAWT
jgi:hypothetical protein